MEDKVRHASVLEKVDEERRMLNTSTIWQQQHRWLEHVRRNEVLLRHIVEGRMKGKAYHGRKRLHVE